ncbi:hypothetical protein ACKWTF_015497 [Chironomus riparius]
MGKYFVIFVSFFLTICKLSSSTEINCGYGDNGNYQGILGYIYQCEVENDSNIETKESATITAFKGLHRNFNSDVTVFGIRAEGKTFKYFPQSMEKIFKNLKVIDFYRVGMVEIHESDLKPFPDLVVLYLGHNRIETLESGLFDHNPKLQVIAFPYNGIKHIYGNIFDNLHQLSRFWFKGNDCINSEYNSRSEISTAIEHVKEHCAVVTDMASEESELDDNLQEHEDESDRKFTDSEEDWNSKSVGTEQNYNVEQNGSAGKIGNFKIIGLLAIILLKIFA